MPPHCPALRGTALGQVTSLPEPFPRLGEISMETVSSTQTDISFEQSPAGTRARAVGRGDFFTEIHDLMEVAQGEIGLVHEQVDLSKAEVGAAQAILDGKIPGSGRRELLRQPHRQLELPRCFACPADLAEDVAELLVGDRAAHVGRRRLGAGASSSRPAIAVSSRLRRMGRVAGVSPRLSWTSKTSLS